MNNQTGKIQKQGRVKWFSPEKGFGFISVDDGSEDLFVYYKDIISNEFKTLEKNQLVSFDIIQAARGPQAANVKIIRQVN